MRRPPFSTTTPRPSCAPPADPLPGAFPKPAARRAPASRTKIAPEAPRTGIPPLSPPGVTGDRRPPGAGAPEAAQKRRERPPARNALPAHALRTATPPPREESGPDPDATLLLTGIKPVLEILETAPERLDCVFLRKGRHVADMDRLLDHCRRAGVRFSLLDADRFARLYPGGTQGVAARLSATGFITLEALLSSAMDAPLPLVLFLDQVQDPGNAGTLARTLYALGGAGLVIPRHNGVYLGATAARASAGALARLPVTKAANLGQALDKAAALGFTLYGTAAPSGAASLPFQDLFSLAPRLPAALILGAEENGLRSGIRNRCHSLLTIPLLRPFDSLNVAQAGAIILGWFSRHAPRRSPAAASPANAPCHREPAGI